MFLFTTLSVCDDHSLKGALNKAVNANNDVLKRLNDDSDKP
jgi:hypothetical protein